MTPRWSYVMLALDPDNTTQEKVEKPGPKVAVLGAGLGTEPAMVISGSNTLLAAGFVPNPASIISALGPGGGTFPYTVLSGNNSHVTFDQRGVIEDEVVYALYLGNADNPSSGYRAIIALPSGGVQVWTASSAGNWQRVS